MRCEGYRKYGSFMTFGPRQWVQCENEGVMTIRFMQDGKEQTLPACVECLNDCVQNKVQILEVKPITDREA